jgi:hypothetical protein
MIDYYGCFIGALTVSLILTAAWLLFYIPFVICYLRGMK